MTDFASASIYLCIKIVLIFMLILS